VLDYRYTFAFLAPSGRATRASRLLLPIRRLLARLSPWLLARTLGGASLLAIALTPRAMEHRPGSAKTRLELTRRTP
jgi:hypothetical protein